MKTTAEKIAVMQAFLEGKQIESHCAHTDNKHDWYTSDEPANEPSWNWVDFDYRVAVTKPSINPDHIHPDYKWMATDLNGVSYLYMSKPTLSTRYWSSSDDCITTHMFASFKAGSCDWKDSLVNIREELQK